MNILNLSLQDITEKGLCDESLLVIASMLSTAVCVGIKGIFEIFNFEGTSDIFAFGPATFLAINTVAFALPLVNRLVKKYRKSDGSLEFLTHADNIVEISYLGFVALCMISVGKSLVYNKERITLGCLAAVAFPYLLQRAYKLLRHCPESRNSWRNLFAPFIALVVVSSALVLDYFKVGNFVPYSYIIGASILALDAVLSNDIPENVVGKLQYGILPAILAVSLLAVVGLGMMNSKMHGLKIKVLEKDINHLLDACKGTISGLKSKQDALSLEIDLKKQKIGMSSFDEKMVLSGDDITNVKKNIIDKLPNNILGIENFISSSNSNPKFKPDRYDYFTLIIQNLERFEPLKTKAKAMKKIVDNIENPPRGNRLCSPKIFAKNLIDVLNSIKPIFEGVIYLSENIPKLAEYNSIIQEIEANMKTLETSLNNPRKIDELNSSFSITQKTYDIANNMLNPQ